MHYLRWLRREQLVGFRLFGPECSQTAACESGRTSPRSGRRRPRQKKQQPLCNSRNSRDQHDATLPRLSTVKCIGESEVGGSKKPNRYNKNNHVSEVQLPAATSWRLRLVPRQQARGGRVHVQQRRLHRGQRLGSGRVLVIA